MDEVGCWVEDYHSNLRVAIVPEVQLKVHVSIADSPEVAVQAFEGDLVVDLASTGGAVGVAEGV